MFKLTLIGNLTADPVLYPREWVDKKTGEVIHNNVCNFSVGANEGHGDAKKTQYFRMNAWRGLADICAKYLKKGRQVYIEGVPSVNTYKDKNNDIRSAFEVRVDRLDILQDGKRITATEDTVIEEVNEMIEEMVY